MGTRRERLEKVLKVQRQIKALHETRHAGHLAASRAAQEEAEAVLARFGADDSFADLFPALYHRRIGNAQARAHQSAEAARGEASRVAAASLRADAAERACSDEQRRETRAREEKEQLEVVERRLGAVK